MIFSAQFILQPTKKMRAIEQPVKSYSGESLCSRTHTHTRVQSIYVEHLSFCGIPFPRVQPCKSMEIHESLNGSPWNSTDLHGFPSSPYSPRRPRLPRASIEISMEISMEIPMEISMIYSMGLHGKFHYNFQGKFHGIPWKPVGTPFFCFFLMNSGLLFPTGNKKNRKTLKLKCVRRRRAFLLTLFPIRLV